MRHRKAGWKLGRNPAHRLALFRNLTKALIENERITTTVPKAKALRPFVERLITLAKRGHQKPETLLHARRLVMARLGPVAHATVMDGEDFTGQTVLQKLVDTIAPRYLNRPGGYTRILKLHTRRLGDAGEQAIIELLKQDEPSAFRGQRRGKEAAPAPTVAPTVAPTTPAETPAKN